MCVQLEQLAMQLSTDGEYVDWRRFLLLAAQPWPVPSEQDLLDALAAMRDMDQQNSGYVSRQQFDRVPTLYLFSVCIYLNLYSYVIMWFQFFFIYHHLIISILDIRILTFILWQY